MSRKPRSHTGPNRQLARRRVNAIRRGPAHNPPPFRFYRDYFRVPAVAKGWTEYPAPAGALDADSKDFADTLVRLAPAYQGRVPLAAWFLDRHIRKGMIPFALVNDPLHCRLTPLTEVAADITRAGSAMVAEDAADALHALHARGLLVIDDNYALRLAVPPGRSGGGWLVNGMCDPAVWAAAHSALLAEW